MSSPHPTLWLQDAEASACGSCASGVTVPACGLPRPPTVCDDPALHGDAAALDRVLAALRTIDAPNGTGNLVDAGQIVGLHIGPDEAELSLAFAPRCGVHQQAAEAAFQALRRLLPDTDVYVTHPR